MNLLTMSFVDFLTNRFTQFRSLRAEEGVMTFEFGPQSTALRQV